MQAHLIFEQIPGELATSVIQYLRDDERDIYKSALATLATQKKLRPVFIQKRPVEKQIEWIVDALKRRTSGEIGEQVLQVWLMKGNQEMLVKFLDEMKISHDGEGSVEDLPDELDADALKDAVEKLLADHPPGAVAIYLHVFRAQRSDGWPALNELLESDERLKLGA